jgi:Ca-activated chloride channel homolog
VLQFHLAKVWRSPVGTGGCVLGLLGCLSGLVPSSLHGQTCADSSAATGAVESIACPDGAAAIVVPNDAALPPQSREVLPTPIAEQPDSTYNTDLTAHVMAPLEIGSGNAFFVSWTGPDNTSDFIAIAKPATQSINYTRYTYTKSGSPVRLTAPDEPGQYEIHYVDRLSRGVLARQTVTVIAAAATLQFDAQVGSGSTFDVSWSGPGNNGDYLAIATPESPGNKQRSYRYTRQGSPLALTAPDEPGDYEIRYVQRQSRTVLVSKSLTVIPVVATLEAAAEVKSGSTFDVSWSGPANNGDYLAIATAGSPGGKQRSYRYVRYTRQGSPLALTAPDEPGDYEIRYVQRQSRTVLARKIFRVTE